MADRRRRGANARVEFDDALFAEDMARSGPAGCEAAERKRAELAGGGQATAELIACDAEGRDGTSLPACLKTYIPWPAGHWGMVFELRIDGDHRPYLAFLAFGVRHHPQGSTALTVYEVAHRRLRALRA